MDLFRSAPSRQGGFGQIGADEKTLLRPSSIPQEQWQDWHWQVRNQITTGSELENWVRLSAEERKVIQASHGKFHFSMTPYWASLMDANDPSCPIRRQSIPVEEEFRPAGEEAFEARPQSVQVAGGRLTHFYPDRASIAIHEPCIVYCRFCPKKAVREGEGSGCSSGTLGQSGNFPAMTVRDWEEIRSYILSHPEIQELILSGGEPLLLNDDLLRDALFHLKGIPSVRMVRIQTRVLSVMPQRVTASLAKILKNFQPLYVVAHVNHPKEVTAEFMDAAALLIDSGVPVVSETVLLREVNDKPGTLYNLFSKLYHLRVRPYRLLQCSRVQGAEHFRTSLSTGLRMINLLHGRISGLALPEYVVDTPGGKIPLRNESILSRNRKRLLLRNHEGKVFIYSEKIFPLTY